MPWRFVRRCWWGAEISRLFPGPVGRYLAGAAQIFPVDDTRPSETLGTAESVLKAGYNLIWFPESWRSPDGSLQEFLRGVGVLANDCRPIVVPVWIEGTFEALPRRRRWPRLVPLRLRIGAPVAPDDYRPAAADDAAAATARALRDRLVDLAAAA
jgi:long-chain acyl-CoA synthetase